MKEKKKKQLKACQVTKSYNESVANHSVLCWAESIKRLTARKGKHSDTSRIDEGWCWKVMDEKSLVRSMNNNSNQHHKNQHQQQLKVSKLVSSSISLCHGLLNLQINSKKYQWYQ